MKNLKQILAAGLICASSFVLSSFTDSSYQKGDSMSGYSKKPSMRMEATDETVTPDCIDITVYEQDDANTLYTQYGYTRGDMLNVLNYNYDPSTAGTFSGTVRKVLRARYPDGECYLLAIINNEDGNTLVNLAPVWHIDQNGMTIDENDTIQVRGSKVRMNGRFLIIGSEVKKEGKVAKLRDVMGASLWDDLGLGAKKPPSGGSVKAK